MNKERGSHVCTVCHSIVIPDKQYKGTFAMELFVWIGAILLVAFTSGVSLIVAIAYSLWRIVNKPKVCPACKAKEIVPVDTPAGIKIIKDSGLIED